MGHMTIWIISSRRYSFTKATLEGLGDLEKPLNWLTAWEAEKRGYLERSLDMAMTYKQKLIGEINVLPEELIPRFYRIVRTLRWELMNKTAVTPKRGSLRGLWGNSEIDESHILAAKKSLSLTNARRKGVELRHGHPHPPRHIFRIDLYQ